jgi:hypothetical protein
MHKPLLALEKKAFIGVSPAEFTARIIALSTSLNPKFRSRFSYSQEYPPRADLMIAIIEFEGGKLIVNKFQDIGSELRIQMDNAFDIPDVIKDLETEIRELGWFVRIDNQSPGMENQIRKPGRPRNPDNEWARKQVYERRRDKREVFVEWQERRRSRDDWLKLEDPWDSFQKMLRMKPKK